MTLHESYLIIIISVLIAITTVVHCFYTVFLFFFSVQTKFPKSNNCVLGSLLFFWSHLSGCQLHKLVIQTRKSMVNHSKKKKHVIVFSNSTNSCSCFCFTFSVVRVIMAQIKNTVKLRNTQSYTHGKQGWVEGKATSSFVFFIILPFSKKWIKWVGEKVQQLRALVTLPEYRGSIPRTHKGSSQSSVTVVSGDLMLSSGLGGYQAHTWCKDMHANKNTHTHKKWKLHYII